jgi:CDP-4-dehydro-6-deoxyglucose reductase
MPAQFPKPQKYQARVIQKEMFSSKVFHLTLQLDNPQTINFIPGQFLSIAVGPGANRSYSIASGPSRNTTIDLLVDVAPGGPGSQYFLKEEVGQPVSFIGPMGKFILEKEEGPIVFLATGTGVAPFKSMLEYLFEKQVKDKDFHKRQIYLYLGFRHEENIFWHDYLESRSHEHPNFHYLVTLSQPTEQWLGCRGYVQTCVDTQLFLNPDTQIYICGGRNMVKGTLEFLRAQKVAEDKLHFEPF